MGVENYSGSAEARRSIGAWDRRNIRRDTVSLPCCHPVVKKIIKPKNPCYPKELTALGDHIRQKRLDLKLEQKDVAKMIQVSKDTICLWENNRCQPGLRFYPAIMDFLGYCPWGHIQAWGERLNRYRIHQGLSLEQFAQELGIDSGTLARQLKKNPSAYFKKKIAAFQKRWRVSDSKRVIECLNDKIKVSRIYRITGKGRRIIHVQDGESHLRN